LPVPAGPLTRKSPLSPTAATICSCSGLRVRTETLVVAPGAGERGCPGDVVHIGADRVLVVELSGGAPGALGGIEDLLPELGDARTVGAFLLLQGGDVGLQALHLGNSLIVGGLIGFPGCDFLEKRCVLGAHLIGGELQRFEASAVFALGSVIGPGVADEVGKSGDHGVAEPGGREKSAKALLYADDLVDVQLDEAVSHIVGMPPKLAKLPRQGMELVAGLSAEIERTLEMLELVTKGDPLSPGRSHVDGKPFEEGVARESEDAGIGADYRFDPRELGRGVVVGGGWSAGGIVFGGTARGATHLSVLRSLMIIVVPKCYFLN
jgi:hypothetical protein